MPDNCFDITPLDQSNPIVNNPVFNLNYTNQDFWSMKARLKSFIKEKFANEFNDFVESSLAIMLIENWAFLADTLSFKMDQIANEIFIDTVTEIENAFRLCKLVGFTPTPPIAARSLWTATINNSLTFDLRISPGLSVELNAENRTTSIELYAADSDNNPLFEDDIIIPAGSIVNKSIVGLEGRTTNQTFTGNGEVNQIFTLSQSPVIYDSIRVEVEGTRWKQVDYFTDSQKRMEYRIEFDSSYQAYIVFGNSRSGAIPSLNSTISVTYRVGGGTIGNITTGAKETQRVISASGFDISIPVTFRNYTKGEFGYNGDTIEDIRNKLPAWVRAQNRAVSGTDYKTLSEQFITPYNGQIGKATAVLRNHGCAGNIIDIYILAKDGEDGLANANSQLKSALSNYLESVKMLTDYICIKNGVVLYVDVHVDITLDKFYRKFEDQIKERVSRRVTNFFSLNNWEYKEYLKDTDIIKILSDITEVSNFDINLTTIDSNNSGNLVVTKFYEIIRPDTINISFIYE